MNSSIHNFALFSKQLKELSFDNLPGVEAQLKMAPSIRESHIRGMGAGKSPIPSAVMLLIYPSSRGQAFMVLIKRTNNGGAHAGQISFPGGRYDAADLNLQETALRETKEEIGALANELEVIGKLTDLYIPPSNFMVSPYVSIAAKKPNFFPDPKEVSGLIEVNLIELVNPKHRGFEKIRLQEGLTIETPCFYLKKHIVWGATAMILNEFAEYCSF